MRAVIDACVLYPSVARGLVLGLAKTGTLTPIWSERLLEEWRRTALRRGGAVEGQEAERAIAEAAAWYPGAIVPPNPELEARLWLPDPNDIHVLATALGRQAETVVTFNLKDFPKRALYDHGVTAIHPDTLLTDAWLNAPSAIESLASEALSAAEARAGQSLSLKALLKRARLPRLAKAVTSA